MTKMVWSADASKPGVFQFSIVGPYYSHGSAALTTGITYNTSKPPIFQGAELKIDAVTDLVVKAVSFDSNNEPVKREDANTATTGIKTMYAPTRNDGPKLTITMELTATTVLDLITQMIACTTSAISFRFGTVTGNTFHHFADFCQIDSISLAEGDGIRNVDVTYVQLGNINASGDDEYESIMY